MRKKIKFSLFCLLFKSKHQFALNFEISEFLKIFKKYLKLFSKLFKLHERLEIFLKKF